MSNPEKVEKSEVFQMQDFYQQLIKFKLDEERRDWAESDPTDGGKAAHENGKNAAKNTENDAKKRQKPFAKSFTRTAREGEFAFGMIPEGQGAEEAIKLADGQDGFAVDSLNASRNLMPLVFDFGNKNAENAQSEQKIPEIKQKNEKDEQIIIFQISESEILNFFDINDLKTVDAEKLNENEKIFDLFGQILQKNDSKAILQKAMEKRIENIEIFTNEFGQKKLVCGAKSLDLDPMPMEKDGELVLVQTDLDRRTLRKFGKVDGFYSA